MTKDIFTASGKTHRGSNCLRTATMCFSFKWVPRSQRLSHNTNEIVVLAFSSLVDLMKELRIRKWACLTENSATNAWNLNFNNGNFNNNNKTNENSVRPVSAFDRNILCVYVSATNDNGYNRRNISEYYAVLW